MSKIEILDEITLEHVTGGTWSLLLASVVTGVGGAIVSAYLGCKRRRNGAFTHNRSEQLTAEAFDIFQQELRRTLLGQDLLLDDINHPDEFDQMLALICESPPHSHAA